MPTYNYYCKNCESYFSYFQKMSESHKSKCENCGKEIDRIITGGTGLIFKGSGFYLTDYKNEKKKDSSLTKNQDTSKNDNEKNQKSKNKKEKNIKSKKIEKNE